jgi:hypothetical protein
MLSSRIVACGFVLTALLAAAARVTAVRLHLEPESYAGPCPGHVQLVGEITTDGPGTVWYRFLAGAVSHSPEGTVTFDSAGTKTVTIEGTFRVTPSAPHASLLASMQDEQGNHGPQNVSSGPVDYNITCGGQTSAAPVGRADSIRLPEGTTASAQYQDGTAATFSEREQVALVFVEDIRSLEADPCARFLHKLCSLEELLHGVQGKAGRTIGFKRSPLEDTAYRYAVTISGDRYQVEAVPRRAGLGGFLVLGNQRGFTDLYYNPQGAATSNDKKLPGHGFNGDDFIAR